MAEPRTPADLGGLAGFGPVRPEADEPLFHTGWERHALAITLAMGGTGRWTIDHARAARESLALAQYRQASYYQIWLDGLDNLMLRFGLVDRTELADGVMRSPPVALPRKLSADDVAAALARGSPCERPQRRPALFAAGERVRTRATAASAATPSMHTRLPSYARDRVAQVVAVQGVHVYADSHALGDTPPFDEDPQWLYTVEFDGRELWGPQAERGLRVSIDAWEPYLEALESGAQS